MDLATLLCTHTHTYTHTYTHTHMYTHTCTHTHMYTHMYIHTHTCTHTHMYTRTHTHMHCNNIWVTSTIFWSSQLNACCVHGTLQASRDASHLIESLSVVETLLLFVNLGLFAESLAMATFLAFLPLPCNQGTPPGVDQRTPNLTRNADIYEDLKSMQ